MEEKNNLHFLPLFISESVYIIEEPAPFFTETLTQNKADATPLAEKIPTLGDNVKHILVLVDEEHTEFISQQDQVLLHNILKAVHLSLQDIALVNVSKIPLASTLLPQALDRLPFHTLISFGAQVAGWTLCNYFSKYTVTFDDAKRKILLADQLSELANDPYKKKRLWLCLQQLFTG